VRETEERMNRRRKREKHIDEMKVGITEREK
jgi:hypothetical protein